MGGDQAKAGSRMLGMVNAYKTMEGQGLDPVTNLDMAGLAFDMSQASVGRFRTTGNLEGAGYFTNSSASYLTDYQNQYSNLDKYKDPASRADYKAVLDPNTLGTDRQQYYYMKDDESLKGGPNSGLEAKGAVLTADETVKAFMAKSETGELTIRVNQDDINKLNEVNITPDLESFQNIPATIRATDLNTDEVNKEIDVTVKATTLDTTNLEKQVDITGKLTEINTTELPETSVQLKGKVSEVTSDTELVVNVTANVTNTTGDELPTEIRLNVDDFNESIASLRNISGESVGADTVDIKELISEFKNQLDINTEDLNLATANIIVLNELQASLEEDTRVNIAELTNKLNEFNSNISSVDSSNRRIESNMLEKHKDYDLSISELRTKVTTALNK